MAEQAARLRGPVSATVSATMRAGDHASRIALISVALFIASIPTENAVSIPVIGSLSRVFGVLAFLTTVWSLNRGGMIRLRAPSLFLVMAAVFCVWSLTSYFWSIEPGVTLSNAFTYFQLLMLVWLVHEVVRETRHLVVLMQAYVLGCYLLIGIVLLRFLTASGGGFRDVGSFNANGVAIACALAVPMAWFLQNYEAARPAAHLRPMYLRVLNTVYPVAAIVAVVLSASRGGLIVFLTCLLVVPLTLGHLSWWRRVVLAAVLVVGSASLILVAEEQFPELQRNLDRLTSTGDELTTGTLTGRTVIWEHGVIVFRKSPIVGYGQGTFRYAIQEYGGIFKGAHNALLSVAVGTGVIGALMFVSMFFLALVSVLRSPARLRPYLLVLFVGLVVATVPTNSEADKFMWFVLSLVGTQAALVIVPDDTGDASAW